MDACFVGAPPKTLGRQVSLIGAVRELLVGGWRKRGLQMRVEVNDADGTVCTVNASEKWQSNGVVAAESDHTGKRCSLERWAFLVGVCRRFPRK